MVMTAPGEKLIIRRLPWEELDLQCDIKLVFVQKIAFVLRKKFNKNCCHQSCTF